MDTEKLRWDVSHLPSTSEDKNEETVKDPYPLIHLNELLTLIIAINSVRNPAVQTFAFRD